MRRLRFLLAGRRANGERGVIAVLTAILVMFVAIGMLALTVDLGNITYNRAQLQNGADASALALASACAKSSSGSAACNVTPDLTDLAVKNANATDQSMSIRTDGTATCINSKGAAYVTAHGGTTGLPPCPATEDTTSLSSCQPWPLTVDQSAVSYVEATTQTKMKKDGTNVLPFNFGQLLGSGQTGTIQNTCSRAAWGPASNTGATLPITMGACDWQQATAKGVNYAPKPPYTVAPNTGSAPPPEVTSPTNLVTGIFAHASDANMCSNQPNGGFSWLKPDTTSDPNCTVTIGNGDWGQSDPGGNVPCKGVLASLLGTVVAVPIFDYTNGLSGDNATYHMMGVAAFYLAGYDNVPSAQPKKTASVYNEPSTVCTGNCNGSTTYVWGWFVSTLLPVGSGSIGTGPDLGAEVVVSAG